MLPTTQLESPPKPKTLPSNRGKRSAVPISQQQRHQYGNDAQFPGAKDDMIDGLPLQAIVMEDPYDELDHLDDPKFPLAKCDECPLMLRQPVSPLVIGAYGLHGSQNPKLILALPSKPDVMALKALVHMLKAVEMSINDVAFVYTVQCTLKNGAHWPPTEAVDACRDEFTARLDMINCSTPEIQAELEGYIAPITYPPPIITFGQETLDALFGTDVYNLSTIRGASLWRNGQRIVPTWLLGTLITQPGRYQDILHDFHNVITYPIYEQPDDSEKAIKHDIAYHAQYIEQFHEEVLNTTGRACLDLETSGFDPWNDKILCVALGYGAAPYKALIVTQELAYSPEGIAALSKLFNDQSIDWVFQNGKFDIRFLNEQLKTAPEITEDTLLLHYTLDERLGTHGLKELSQEKLGVSDYEKELHKHLKRKADSYDTIPTPVLFRYAALDVIYTLRLFDRLMREMQDQPTKRQLLRLYRFLVKAENVFTEVEQNGLVVDKKMAQATLEKFTEIAEGHIVEMQRLVGDGRKNLKKPFNPGSWQQVQYYMYKVRGMPIVKLFRNHKDESTAREALDKLLEKPEYAGDRFLTTLVNYRMVKKILSTYVAPLEHIVHKDGRLRTDFKLFGTVTGRLSSSKPNLMNIPRPAKNDYAKPIRNMFIAAPGNVLVYADYSQAELRVLAHYCQDPFLLEVFRTGRDLHKETSVILFGEDFKSEDRMIAKMLNFGLVYGRSAQSIALERGIPLLEAQKIMDDYFAQMPQVLGWLETTRNRAVKEGYLVTEMGRMRRFGLITDKNLREIRNQASNFPVSSIASDICLTALMNIHEEFKQRRIAKILLMVHDSILSECRKEDAKEVTEIVTRHMEAAPPKVLVDCSVPFKVDSHVGLRWGALG
jgi:DNA polymerase-1